MSASVNYHNITLPSNASHREFPSNTNGDFKIRLADELILNEGEWEIALTDIHYFNTWLNVDTGELTVREVLVDRDVADTSRTIAIPKGRYKTVEDVVATIMRWCGLDATKSASSVILVYNTNTNAVHAGTYPTTYKFTLSKDLREILGLPDRELRGGPTKSIRTPDVFRGMTALYVYLSLVEPRFVGVTKTSLLRTVPITGNPHENVYMAFSAPQFLPVGYTRTRVIQVTIARDNGETVNFQSGKTILNLQLRRTRH